jgi:hypothetical protein
LTPSGILSAGLIEAGEQGKKMTKYQIKNVETGETISPERFTFETMTGAEVGIVHIEDICDLLDKPCPPLEVVPVREVVKNKH